MKYNDMIIEAFDFDRKLSPEKIWHGRFKVRVFSSPVGEMSQEQAVPVQFDDGQLQATLQRLESRDLDSAGLVVLGRTLALLLFPPGPEGATTSVRGLLADNLKNLKPDIGLRLRLRIPSMLAAVPWEYIYVDRAGGGDGMDGFLALDPRVAIVRHEVLAAPLLSLPLLSGDIKVVAALASSGGPQLNLAKERADLEEAFAGQPGINPIFLPDATLDEIQAAIPESGIFHFAGHGMYDRKQSDLPGVYTGIGSIALVDQNVDAEQLGINLRGCGVRLAMLGGCETGRREGIYVWSGIVPALIKAGIPAVVANQYKITDTCATAFSRQFYRALVGGLPIERAVSAGRIAAYNADPNGRDWGVSVLYLRAENGELFKGAGDAQVRDTARKAVEQLVVQQYVKVVQQRVKVDQRNAKIGGIYFGSSTPPVLKESTPTSDSGPEPRPKVDGVSSDSSQKERPSEVANTAPTEGRDSPARIELAGEALRPVLVKLIADLGQDDLPFAFQCVFDLSYELARGSDADTALISNQVKNLIQLVPAVEPELNKLFSHEQFRGLSPMAALLPAF